MAGNNVDPYAEEIASAKRLAADKAYKDTSWSDWAGDAVGNALNTARSVLPTALGGKGEVGLSDMARGAYESGKSAVTFPGDVISGKQPLYDERGMPLESAVGRSFNTAATIGGAAAPIPRPPNSLGVFAGIRSKTADKNALTKAQIMERQGASPEDIRANTGWNRGTDEQWRYEIPDTNAVVRPYNLKDKTSPRGEVYKSSSLSDLLDHPELFNAYPEFKTMQVNETFNPDINGYYMPRFERGTINPGIVNPYIALSLKNLPLDANKLSTLLHEAQHGIQQKEGFAPGASPSNFEPDTVPNPRHQIYKDAMANDPEAQEFHSILKSPEYAQELAASNKMFDEEVQPRIDFLNSQARMTGKDSYDEVSALLDNHRELIREKFPHIGRLDDVGDSLRSRGIPIDQPREFLTPNEAYRHTAGEVESRNVQKRMNMPEEELKKSYPPSTEDIPRNQQLIDWNDTSWRKGYAGRGRVVEDAAGDALSLAKRIMQGTPTTETIRGADLLKKTQGLTEDPFGFSKFAKPLSEMEYTVEKVPGALEPYKSLDPHDLVRQNATIAGHISDLTAAGRKVTNISGTELTEPLLQRGGVDFQRTTPYAWANRQGAGKGLNRKLNEAAGYEYDKKSDSFSPTSKVTGDPLYTTPVFMGSSSANSSHMVGVPLIRMIPNLPISTADKLAFDAMMAERFPGWPGIDKTKEAEQFMYSGDIPGSAISNFINYASAKKWKGAGFPDTSEIMFSAMDPRLVGVPQGSVGMGFKEFNPGNNVIVKPQDFHPDYPVSLPGKKYTGGFKYQTPSSIMFPEWWGKLKPKLRLPENATQAQHTLMTQVPTQKATNEWADNLMKNWEENPVPWGYADGGEVDDDIHDALRIARAEGGRAGYATDGSVEQPAFITDANGVQYDATGKVIQPTESVQKSNSTAQPQAQPQPQNTSKMFNAAPENYYSEVQPLIDYAMTPIDRPGMASEPDLVNAMRVATQIAAEGQPQEDTRGPANWGRQREELINKQYGETPPAQNQAAINNLLASTVTYPVEALHDIPYEAVRTGDWGSAALEGGMNALFTAPGMAAIGAAARPVYKAIRNFPKAAAGLAGIGATTLGSDQAEAGPERWFSKALEVAKALPMEKMTGEQALAMLRKGVSPEELRWTNTDKFLTSRPQISKGELLEHLKNNQVQTQDIVLGGSKPTRREYVKPTETAIAPFKADWDAVSQKNRDLVEEYGRLPYEEQKARQAEFNDKQYILEQARDSLHSKMINATIEEMGGLGRPTKYHDYSTPGGEGYAETLVTLGNKSVPQVAEKNGMFHVISPNGETMSNQSGGPLAYYSREDAERAAKSLHRRSGSYTSSHWDDPDVLVHTRGQMLDVAPPGANRPYKAWNADETQSDWGQDVRKRGMVDPANDWAAQYHQTVKKNTNDWVEQKAKVAFDAAPWAYDSKFDMAREHARRMAHQKGSYNIAEDLGRQAEYNDVYEKMNKQNNSVAAGPYVGSTEGWTDLAIKKQLDKALDSNADYFTWTPGEAHAERYDLTKHIGKVEYNPDDGSFIAYDPSGKRVMNESINDPSELDNYVGKELADKMRAEEANRRANIIDAYSTSKDPETGEWYVELYGEPLGELFPSRGHAKDYINEMQANDFSENPVSLSGLDLKTGGEGMRGYYDKVYLKRVQDVLKKSTGKPPAIEVIEVQTGNGPRKQFGVRLTDEMREKARFSHFANGGSVNKALALTANL